MVHDFWIDGRDVLTTLYIGAIAGTVLPINSEGIDFAMTALFVVIFVEQWMDKKNRIPEMIGVAVAIVALIIFDASSFVLPAMLAIVALLFVGRKINIIWPYCVKDFRKNHEYLFKILSYYYLHL